MTESNLQISHYSFSLSCVVCFSPFSLSTSKAAVCSQEWVTEVHIRFQLTAAGEVAAAVLRTGSGGELGATQSSKMRVRQVYC